MIVGLFNSKVQRLVAHVYKGQPSVLQNSPNKVQQYSLFLWWSKGEQKQGQRDTDRRTVLH